MAILTIQCKLDPTPEQAQAFDETLEAFARGCNLAIAVGREASTSSNIRIHGLCYRRIREECGLSANLAVRAIARAAGILKVKERRHSTVRPTSADYDQRIFSFREAEWTVSLTTTQGRVRLPLVICDYQRQLLSGQNPTSATLFKRRNSRYFLHIQIETQDPEKLTMIRDVLGVDLGVVNIAVDSNGAVHSGKAIEKKRRLYAHRRRNLQRKGTRAARRKLRTLKGRQARFQKDTNHRISKAIVADAQRTGCAIALEDLGGIRDRVTARKRQRARLANWGFHQLRQFIIYKAEQAGIPVILVDPRNTSRQCPECGYTDKCNRPSQAKFQCIECGFAGPADAVAAGNIASRARAAINRPNGFQTKVAHVDEHGCSECSYKPPL